MMDDEKWKNCPGFEGRYELSDRGRLKNTKTGRCLILTPRTRGNLQVTLYRADGSSMDCSVARLICSAFHGFPPSSNLIAGHHNGLNTDNRAENLFWTRPGVYQGERNPAAKLREVDVAEMRRLSSGGVSYTALAARYGVAISTAFAAVIGRTWKHVPDDPPAQFAVSAAR